ncbi:predicted protein [Naegleria gruberi]|uniref:Predicted protein n=1 Tax=Naegleria gruberi TaxID=5762 RepID=D2VJX0_NAEGR|nr:uncharacterized protein NAEGRDRAFT_69190 [Naegleria gruberi]EFC42763.1 predicted protein [Naegleria gruberi]|eukprot:XP_002675507.1 predicted protein [Naegleria gruberi strain NEG-M]
MGQKQSISKWTIDEHTLSIDDVCKKFDTQFNNYNPDESLGLKSQVVNKRSAQLSRKRRTVIVFRDGIKKNIDSEELVVGDIVMVNSGDIVPADLRILSINGLKVDNCIISGEKTILNCTVDKTHENPFETSNILFKETTIVAGSGYAVVIKIGSDTLIESLAP